MDLIKEILKFVEEKQPVSGIAERIGGKKRKIVFGEEDFLSLTDDFEMPDYGSGKIGDSADSEGIVFINTKIKFIKPVDEVIPIKIHWKKELENVVFIGKTEFNEILFSEDFILFIEATKNASIIFKNCVFQGKIKIRNKETDDYEGDQESKIKLKELKFIDCQMFNNEGGNFPYIRVGFLNVENFELSNLRVPNNAEINIGDCDFGNFKLSNVRNLGKFKIYKINVEKNKKKGIGNFQIDNTSIGDADFQSIDLASFATRTIFDNILSGVQYTNVRWERPNESDVKVGQCPKGGNLERAKKRDTYRMLKNVAQNNNDTPQAFAFYAKEMEYHRAVLINSGKLNWLERMILRFNCWTDNFMQNWLERVILWFNRWTNNFGQNWLLPIGWILIVGGIFYLLLLYSLNGECDDKLWSKFFVFLNPIHKTDFIDEKCWTGWAYSVDFSFRIIEGLLIYQAIQAFRRYSRKF